MFIISFSKSWIHNPKKKKIVLTETIFSFFKNVPFPRGPIINLYYYVMVTPGPTTHTTINHLGGSGLSTPSQTCWDTLYVNSRQYGQYIVAMLLAIKCSKYPHRAPPCLKKQVSHDTTLSTSSYYLIPLRTKASILANLSHYQIQLSYNSHNCIFMRVLQKFCLLRRRECDMLP